MLSLLFAAALAAGPDLSAYEGVARDDFAAWSFTSANVAVSGDTRTTSVLAMYVTPLGGGSGPVAYSIHEITFHCTARTADWSRGVNYAADGSVVAPGTASTGEAWSTSTPGYVQLAETVCAMNGSM